MNKKTKYILIAVALCVATLILGHIDTKWQIADKELQLDADVEWFNEQANILFNAYHIDSIEEDEFDMLYNKLERYDANGRVTTFDAISEIEELNK